MATMIKNGIKNNWGKMIVASIGAFGANYGFNRYRMWQLRARLGEEALKYGDTPVPFFEKPERVVVLVDIRSGNQNGREIYKKDVEPLLLLAGNEILLIESKERGMTKDISQDVDFSNSKAIVVVGDDGTHQEFVTGFMRRQDVDTLRTSVPVAFVATGQHNAFVSALLYPNGGERLAEVRERCEATMAVLRGKTKWVDLVSVTSGTGRSVHCLSGLVYGAPAALISDTFNQDSGLSIRMAKWRQLKEAILAGNQMPKYSAVVKYTPTAATAEVTEEINFGQLFVSSTPSIYGMRVAKDSELSVTDGQLKVSWTAPSSLSALYHLWNAMVGAKKDEDTTMVASFIENGGLAEDTREITGLSEIYIKPLDSMTVTHEEPIEVAEDKEATKSESGDAEATETEPPSVEAKIPTTRTVSKEVLTVPMLVDGEVFEPFDVTVKVLPKHLLICAV
ncbi:hypothetical protein SARC_05541 [Sphaeroforma arctica JP610]|uniref:DAGKc domain-containing protein n=1 Tax=Sphaeroforma arctica JP610 TaxID=667725 RepID=A0A0L0FZB3_9EUKA|nr:hypothetical protein SARC_05541 [Sphaeroforma arctica JP610]KNC82160.1 hypothetical protein SARC_05541 [Sphaeroforma arctica JP610]|eukprot:XP_014156062.1 hypothetical protein SARC_05541 [Sphaeroforma arctica JP610]